MLTLIVLPQIASTLKSSKLNKRAALLSKGGRGNNYACKTWQRVVSLTCAPPAPTDRDRKGFHNEIIESIKFVPRINQLAVVEQRSSVIKMYDARTFRLVGKLEVRCQCCTSFKRRPSTRSVSRAHTHTHTGS